MKNLSIVVVAAAMSMTASSVLADSFAMTYELPNVTSTNDTLAYGGVETFNTLALGVQTVTTDFGTGGVVSGTYSGVNVLAADQWGGAGGSGAYASANYNTSYSLSLSTTRGTGINYFGAFMTAIDPNNTVQFYKGSTEVGTFNLSSILPVSVTGNNAYNYDTAYYNIYAGQPFVFINFVDTSGTFDKIVFSQPASNTGGNFESDNQTVGFETLGVPEPAAWSLMILGVGLVGAVARHRRRQAVAA